MKSVTYPRRNSRKRSFTNSFVRSNSFIILRRMGEYVKFGEDVVFRHVDSLDYLSGSVRCSDGGLGAFRVELSDKLLINLVFKLYPFRSF